MPLYYFDTDDGNHIVSDDEGLVLEGLASIRAEALAALADIARDAVPEGRQGFMRVNVRDKEGQMVFQAALSLQMNENPSKTPNLH